MKSNARTVILTVLILILLSFFAFPPKAAHAQGTYACDFKLNITLNEDNSTSVEQQINIANLENKKLLTDMQIALTFPVTDITVKNGLPDSAQPLGFDYKDDVIDVDLGGHFVKTGNSSTFTLSYKTNSLITVDPSGMRTFVFPKLDICDSQFNTLKVNYPDDWTEPSYSSILGADKPILVIWDAAKSYDMVIDWDHTAGQAIPLPASTFNEFFVSDATKGFNAYLDDKGNEFISLLDNSQKTGNISGVVTSKNTPTGLPVIGTDYYSKLSSSAEQLVLKGTSRQDRYRELLNTFTPDMSINSEPSFTDKQDALGYALVWARALENEGATPYIVYGPVKIPNSNTIFWDYWVGVMVDNSWIEYDPYLEDLTGYINYEGVTPVRQAWGILAEDNLFLVQGLNNIRNINSLLNTPSKQTNVLGENIAASASLNVNNGITRKIVLTVKNDSNHIIYLHDIILNDKTIPETVYGNQGIFPHEERSFNLSNDLDYGSFTSTSAKNTGEVLGLMNGESVSLPFSATIDNDAWVYPVFFIVLLLFYLLLMQLFSRFKHKLAPVKEKIQRIFKPDLQPEPELEELFQIDDRSRDSMGHYHQR